MILDRSVNLLRFLGAQMTDRTVYQLEPRLNRALADLLNFGSVADAFDALVCAEFQINFIRVINRFLCKLLPDQRGKVSADIAAQRQLSVRKSACA